MRFSFVVLIGLCLNSPAFAAESKTDAPVKLRKIESELSDTKERRKALQAEIEALRAEQKSLSQGLIEVAARIQAHEAHMTAAEKRLVKLGVEDKIMRGKLGRRREVLSDMLAALQKLEQHPPPALVIKPDDVLEAIRSAMLLAKIVPEIRAEANALSRELRRLTRLREEISSEKQRLQENAASLKDERKRVGMLLALKKQLTERTQEEILTQKKRAKRLAGEARSLKGFIKRLEEEAIKAAKIAAAKKAEEEAAEKKHAQRTAMLSPSRIKPAVSFERTKGMLAYPAQGQRIRKFGDEGNSGAAAKGITIRTRRLAQVISPGDGWVVYAGEFRGYGQLLIVNGGGGYHVLLAGMARISVETGQFVLAGEPVGTMGEHAARSAAIGIAGGNDPLLYIEFRKDGDSIDPDPWWTGHGEEVKG